MDAGGYTQDEIRDNLADLRSYNAWLGGTRLVVRSVGKILARHRHPARLTLVDVATGSADIPAALARWCQRNIGGAALVAGLDANPDVLREASRYRISGVALVQADALNLPYAAGAVDVAFCSNFLHHLDTAGAVEVLREMRRVSRRGLVAVDLIRSRLSLAAVWLLTRLTSFNRVTRNDGPVSVRRAFTPAELKDLARKAGLDGAVVRRAGLARMVLTWEAA